jgi:hypothetical protein
MKKLIKLLCEWHKDYNEVLIELERAGISFSNYTGYPLLNYINTDNDNKHRSIHPDNRES